MRRLVIYSHAKLNLVFEILGLLPGGYHQIRTIFQNIDLSDKLTFELTETAPELPFEVELRHSQPAIGAPGAPEFQSLADFPLDDNNLILKSAKKFESVTKCGAGYRLTVSIEKKIPIAAGLAGGSSNAAATLKAMESFFGDVRHEGLTGEIAAQLGSDINFCLLGGTKIGTNRGEILHSVKVACRQYFVLLKPRDIAISTPWIYREYDERLAANSANSANTTNTSDRQKHNATERCEKALASGILEELPRSFFNAFEPVCFRHYPEVAELRDMMLRAGCLSANITGSGPTLFGLVPTLEVGQAVHRKLTENFGASQVQFDCWVVESAETGLSLYE